MIGWLWRVLVGNFNQCEHKWKLHTSVTVRDEDDDVVANKLVLQCEKCGDLKVKRI